MMTDDYSNPRKRPRSSSPTFSGIASTNASRLKALGNDSPSGAILASRLRDSTQRNSALNELLKLSCSHEVNFSLDGDEVLNEIVKIGYEALDWEPPAHSSYSKEPPLFNVKLAWAEPVSNTAKTWAKHCEQRLAKKSLDPEKMKPLEVILAIIRNLSFVAANLRLLAFSPDVLALLVGSLYECMSTDNLSAGDDSSSGASSSSNNSTLALPALNTLVNLAPYLDVSGQKLLCDKLFLSANTDESAIFPAPASFGQAADGSWGFGGLWLAKRLDTKEDIVQDVSREMLLQFTHEYLDRVWSIFPALSKVLTDSNSPRLVIMMALDLLAEFINHARVGVVGDVDDEADVPDARSIVVHIPKSVLNRLSDLLYVPRLGPDSLDYIDPVHNIVTRVTTLKLLMSYDATVDTDVRDRTLDILVPLLELDSPALARRLGNDLGIGRNRTRNRLYDALLPILTTQVGRNEAPLLATQLLRELAKAEENKIGLLYLQGRLVALASHDQRVAHLVFNHLYTIVDDGAGAAIDAGN